MNDYTAHYRTLAEYEWVVKPLFVKLQGVSWQLLHGLILASQRREKAHLLHVFFDRQNGPEYLRSRYDKRRGAYPSRLIYLPHQFHPAWGWPACALDQTRRVPAGTFGPRPTPEQALTVAENYWRYNSYFPFKGSKYPGPAKFDVTEQGTKMRPAWGRAERAAFWNGKPNPRQLVAEQLNAVARFLRADAGLAILLETGAPRLGQLSDGGRLLGHVAYFFDCWHRFEEYEQAAPPEAVPTGSPAAELPRATTALPAALLPPRVAESHAYFTDLLALCAQLPPHDAAHTLRTAYDQHKAKGYDALAGFMQRLPSYVKRHLTKEMQTEIGCRDGMPYHFRAAFRLVELRPENFRFWGESDRPRLAARREDVAERLALAEQEQRATHAAEHTENLAWLDELLQGLDLLKAAGGVALSRAGGPENRHNLVIVGGTPPPGWQPGVRSGVEINATTVTDVNPSPSWRPEAPAPTAPTAPTAPATLTVADLCREGFTPADVLALAREVGLADEAGRFCLGPRKPGAKPRKLGAVVGFCKALKGDAKGKTAAALTGTIPELVRAVGLLLSVEVHTTKTATGIAEKYRKLTERALTRRNPTQ